MAPPINAPVAGEIWHLSIEDLFQQVQEAPRLGGDGPFVINLSVSTAPINLPTKPFSSRQDAHVYQIQVTEDGRTRFRLRLGPFKTEDEADAMLAEVRDTYPGALTATASSSDMRVIESMEAKANQRQANQKGPVTQKSPANQKAAVRAAIENFVSPKVAAEKAAPPKSAPPKSAPPKSAKTDKGPLNIIEAAVQAEIAKVEAEISIDLAWPTPELKVPDPAPLRATPAAAPVATAPPPTVAPPAAPTVKATATPAVQAAPPPVIKPVPEPTHAPAATAEPATALVLPELDIPLPAAQKRAAPVQAPVVPEPAVAQSAKPFELQIAPPLSLVGDAPVLTEVVVPRKAPAKNAVQKPVVAAPVLTEVVIPKAKPIKGVTVNVSPAGAHKKPAPDPAPIVATPMVPAPIVAAPAAPAPVVTAQPMPAAPVVFASSAPPAPPAPPTPQAPVVALAAQAPGPVVTAPIPASATGTMKALTKPSVAAPVPPAPVATTAAKVFAPAASASIANSATGTMKALTKPPVASAPVASAPVASAGNQIPPKTVTAPAAPSKPLPVIPQSLVMPRKGAAAKTPVRPLPNKLKSLQHVVVATAPAPVPREVKKLDEPLPDLESTQTIRALTPKELEENDRWFVIQLSLSDHAFDPEAVPNLDIFSEYRLYSVAGLDQGRVVHALRLGFFKEEIGAVAVASYLAAYWDKPTIKRVSVAERERFADQRVEARKDVGATGRHSVIEITDELVARRRRATKAPLSNKTPDHSAEH